MYLRFRDLDVGDKFRFVYNTYTNPRVGDVTMTKTNRYGWYRRDDAPKHAWRTGLEVTVLRVVDINTEG